MDIQNENYSYDDSLDSTPTEEETTEFLKKYEDDILGGLLAAAEFHNEEIPIEIVRDGVVCFSFRIHPLREDEYYKSKELHTKYVRNKKFGGIKIPDDTNSEMYRNELIYQATVKEDRERLWDNHEAWKKLNVLNGRYLIGAVLKAGEKDAILDKLDEISGYNMEMLEAVKNS